MKAQLIPSRSTQRLVTWSWVSKQTLFSQPLLLVRRSSFRLQTFDLVSFIRQPAFNGLSPSPTLAEFSSDRSSQVHRTTTTKTAAEIPEHDCGRCNWRIPVKWLMLCVCDWVSIEDILKQIFWTHCNSVTYLVPYFATLGTLALGLRLRATSEWVIIMEILSCF